MDVRPERMERIWGWRVVGMGAKRRSSCMVLFGCVVVVDRWRGEG